MIMRKLILVTVSMLLTALTCEAKVGAEESLYEQGKHIMVTILYDNYVHSKGMRSDWGFSCVVMGMEKNILFDTGTRGDLLLSNMEKLKVEPKDIDVIVLSHNHRDHTGGLLSFLGKNSDVLVYLPPSCPDAFARDVKRTGARVAAPKAFVKICEDVYLTGPMGEMIKEQSMIVDTANGAVVVAGCSHPGIVSIVQTVKAKLARELHLVFGGFHLLGKSEAEIKDIIAALKKLGVQNVGPTHCTGERAIKLFKQAYGPEFVQMGVGRVLTIPKKPCSDKCS